MPFVKVNLNEYDLKLVRRLARHEKRGEASMLNALVKMSLEVVRREERTGWCYGPAPELPPLPPPPPRFASKEQRDAWVLYGIQPGNDGAMITAGTQSQTVATNS